MKTRFHTGIIAALLGIVSTVELSAQGTAFTYQGRLNDGGNPATGIYDLRFTIYDSANNPGVVIAGPLTNAAIGVSKGYFTVTLDFGSGVFTGAERWLDLAVRTNGAGVFSTLTPRQAITATPYAVHAASSAVAAAFSGSLGGDVGGTQGATVVGSVGFYPAAAVASGAATANAATGANVPGTIVKRDGAGNFSAGTINASFSGNGAGLTDLNASALGSGAVPDERLSANVARLNAGQAFTGSNVFAALVIATNPANQIAGAFAGDGAGLTNLSATTLAPGSITAEKLADGAVTAAKLSAGAAVKTLNGLAGDVNLAAGSNITFNPAGNGLEISATASALTNIALSLIDSGGAIRAGAMSDFVLALVATPAVGNSPPSILAADVNGDGRVDLISANYPSSSLLVLTNNGGRAFLPAASPGVGSGVYSVAAADVNGDGRVDLISANSGTNTLSVLTNDGSGSFVLSSSPTVGTGPRYVLAADINSDARVDLISANFFSGTLTVLTNNGSGAFVLAASLNVGGNPSGLAAVDVNSDGRMDLINANESLFTLSVLTNNGSAGFALAGTPAVGGYSRFVAAADINGDGRVDLISAISFTNTLSVLTNNGSGGFALATPTIVGGNASFVVTADINGDGKVDLISANASPPSLFVLTNNGSGGFSLVASPAVGANPVAIAVADFNNDGRLDLVSANYGANTLSVLLNTPLSIFAGRFIGDGSLLTGVALLDSVGRLGVGRTATANRLEVEGEASKTSAGSWLANSDRRIKCAVQSVSNALETLDRVRLVSFRYTDDYRALHPSIADRRYLNVIAQEFQQVFPDDVKSSGEKLRSGDSILQVDTYPLTIYSAAAIQQLNAKLEAEEQTLRAELQAKDARISQLEHRLSALETIISRLNPDTNEE